MVSLLPVLCLILALSIPSVRSEGQSWKPDGEYSVPPIAVFHGITDDCGSPQAELVYHLGKTLNTYVACVPYSANLRTVITNIVIQGSNACQAVKDDYHFDSGYSIVGVSQGGLIGRYVVETCDTKGPVHNFISLGGPQQGVSRIPDCLSGFFCNLVLKAANSLVYTDLVQRAIGPAGYFKDPLQKEKYLEKSLMLVDLNNEHDTKTQKYKDNMMALKSLVLVMFGQDEVVGPKESEWFGMYDEDNKTLLPLESTRQYSEDLLGLKTLNESGRLFRYTIDKAHIHWTDEEIDKLVVPHLRE